MTVQVHVAPDGLQRLDAGMPSLTLEGTLRSKRSLGNALGVNGPPDLRGKLIADGLVRLVDKSVLEYQAAREALVQFFPHGRLSHYHRAQDHFESCVQSLHRAIVYLDRLRGLGYKREDGRPLVPRPREFCVLRDPVKAQVRKFRDYLEHLDEDIVEGRYAVASGEAGPQLGYESAALADASLRYTEVVRWIQQMFSVAGELSYVVATVHPSPTAPPPGGADA